MSIVYVALYNGSRRRLPSTAPVARKLEKNRLLEVYTACCRIWSPNPSICRILHSVECIIAAGNQHTLIVKGEDGKGYDER